MGLAKARKEKGLTQSVASDTLLVDRSTISKWETGEAFPRAEMLPKIAELYGCTIDDLFKEDIDPA